MRFRLILVMFALVLAATSSAAQQATRLVGQTWHGPEGVRVSVAEIMRLQAIAPQRGWVSKRTEKDGPDRQNLIQNPGSPAVSQFPPAPLSGLSLSPDRNRGPLFSSSTSFTGVTSAETGFMPPDTMGDVSPTQVLITINGRIKVFNRSGVLGSLNADLDVFFSSVHGGPGVADPRCRFDRLSNRWIILAMSVHSANNRIVFAVSDGPTITNATVFTFFQFQHNLVAPAGNLNQFFDYPTMGVDSQAIYIGGSLFSGNSFVNTSLFVVRKSSILGAGPMVVSAFRNVIGATEGMFTAQGVDNDDPDSTTGYFIGVDAFAFGKLVLRRVTDPGGTPILSGDVPITVPSTSFPRSAPALGSLRTLDALDDRLIAAKIHHNAITGAKTLWTAHAISVNTTGVAVADSNSAARAGSRWYQFSNFEAIPSLVQSGTVFDSASSGPLFHYIPSLAMNRQGHMLMGFTRSSTSTPASTGMAFRLSSDPLGTIQPPTTLHTGASGYNLDAGNPQRWGDYSHTVVDPSDGMTVWSFQEFCSAVNTFAVRVHKFLAPPPASITSISPNTLAQGDTQDIVVTGSSVAGSGFFDPGPTFPNRLAGAFSGAGLTVNSVTFTSPTQITLNVTADGAAATGARDLTVTNPDGQSVSATGVLTIEAGGSPVIQSVTVAPIEIPGGNAKVPKLTVRLLSDAPAGGLTVNLSTSHPALVSMPATLTIPAGKRYAKALIEDSPVQVDTPVTLSATFGSDTKSAILTLKAPVVQRVTVGPQTVIGGSTKEVTATVVLTAPAPTGGVTATLTSTNVNVATTPPTLFIPAGEKTGTFPVTHFAVGANRNANIRASLNGIEKGATLTVVPPTLKSLVILPTSVVGGTSTLVQGTVELTAPAPVRGIKVALSSDLGSVTVPIDVRVLEGQTVATFTIGHQAVSSQQVATVTGELGVTRTDTLVVRPPALTNLTLSPNTVKGGSGTVVTGTVTITGPAPAGGFTINLSSSQPGVASVPSTVTIAAGATSATFNVTHFAVGTSTTVTITAEAAGIVRTRNVIVNP